MPESPPQYPLYPIHLKVEGTRCIVVGGGPIGVAKARDLLLSGAHVDVVSPELALGWDELQASAGARLVHHRRRYESGDVEGTNVVIAATGDPQVDNRVHEDAKAAGALVNVADVPDRCDFYNGSTVRRGKVVICIGTAGTSPSIAVRLKRRIDAAVPPHVDLLSAELGEARPALLDTFPEYDDRARRLGFFVEGAMQHLDKGADPAAIQGWIRTVLACRQTCPSAEHCCAFQSTEATR